MKSITLKTNNSQTIDYIQKEITKINIDNLYISLKDFKHYKNIIIHYTGIDNLSFLESISNILSFLVIYEYEEIFLKQIIFKNYFYFSHTEREIILNNCFDIMVESKNYLKNKFAILKNTFLNHLSYNKSLFINGFVTFRLNNYINILNSIVDDSVNSFILEKEYKEFISLLKLYINSQKPLTDVIHLVYSNDFTIILDKDKNIIENSSDSFNAKFLSDITFSTNDCTLNLLLNLLPCKIYIHLIDNTVDEFIKTISLIFENRYIICNECDICNLYKNIKKNKINFLK